MLAEVDESRNIQGKIGCLVEADTPAVRQYAEAGHIARSSMLPCAYTLLHKETKQTPFSVPCVVIFCHRGEVQNEGPDPACQRGYVVYGKRAGRSHEVRARASVIPVRIMPRKWC